MSRLWSGYAYLCLEGNEGHRGWTKEEIAADDHTGCPLNPLEWFTQRKLAAQLTRLLFPPKNRPTHFYLLKFFAIISRW